MRRFAPSLLLLPFIGIAYMTFKPDFGGHNSNKIGNWYINVPDTLPPYNGLYWSTKKNDTLTISPYNSREYQIQLDMDSLQVWDGDTMIGKVKLAGTELDSLIYKDNE